MAQNVVPTKNFARLDCLRSLELPMAIDAFSTLNEAFNIGNINPPIDGYPSIKYLAIGRGGHTGLLGANSNTLINIKQHGSADAALFEQIPFVMVPTTADIDETTRLKYRIRVLEQYNGVNYFCYYLRVMPTTASTVETRVVTLTNGAISSDVPFVPSLVNLGPNPVDISNTVINVSNGRHLVVQAVTSITLDSTEVENIISAAIIKYGSIAYATISEIGIVSGYDVPVTTSLGSVAATYTEIQTAQVMAFIGVLNDLQQHPPSLTIQYALTKSFAYPPTSTL